MPQASLSLPLFLILFGAIWFLKSTDILPATSTLIAIGLAVVGIIVMVFDGINKQIRCFRSDADYAGAAVLPAHGNTGSVSRPWWRWA